MWYASEKSCFQRAFTVLVMHVTPWSVGIQSKTQHSSKKPHFYVFCIGARIFKAHAYVYAWQHDQRGVHYAYSINSSSLWRYEEGLVSFLHALVEVLSVTRTTLGRPCYRKEEARTEAPVVLCHPRRTCFVHSWPKPFFLPLPYRCPSLTSPWPRPGGFNNLNYVFLIAWF